MNERTHDLQFSWVLIKEMSVAAIFPTGRSPCLKRLVHTLLGYVLKDIKDFCFPGNILQGKSSLRFTMCKKNDLLGLGRERLRGLR